MLFSPCFWEQNKKVEVQNHLFKFCRFYCYFHDYPILFSTPFFLIEIKAKKELKLQNSEEIKKSRS